MKKYISDIITDYLTWRPGCAYFISAQTGTGKSTFVFEKLLKNAVRQNKYIIYLCNNDATKPINLQIIISPPHVDFNVLKLFHVFLYLLA